MSVKYLAYVPECREAEADSLKIGRKRAVNATKRGMSWEVSCSQQQNDVGSARRTERKFLTLYSIIIIL